MYSIQDDVVAFRAQLGDGSIQRAYQALISYMMSLRSHFARTRPSYAVSGLYQGYMDMTYFAVVPPALKQRSLKVAIVFNYEAFRFEAWLAGSNRAIQQQYWELVRDSEWDGCRVIAPAKGVDSILECDLADGSDLGDSEGLTASIDRGTAAFIERVERFLAEHDGV